MDSSYTIKTPANYLNNILFTGREVDILDNGSLKIQNNRNRSYDYYTGRWLQRDPIGYVDGMNLYEYGISNPVKMVDYLGTFVLPIPIIPFPIPPLCGNYNVNYKSHSSSFTKSTDCPPDGSIKDNLEEDIKKEISESLPKSGAFGCKDCKIIFNFSFPYTKSKSGSKTFCWQVGLGTKPPKENGKCPILYFGPCTVTYKVSVTVDISISMGFCCN